MRDREFRGVLDGVRDVADPLSRGNQLLELVGRAVRTNVDVYFGESRALIGACDGHAKSLHRYIPLLRRIGDRQRHTRSDRRQEQIGGLRAGTRSTDALRLIHSHGERDTRNIHPVVTEPDCSCQAITHGGIGYRIELGSTFPVTQRSMCAYHRAVASTRQSVAVIVTVVLLNVAAWGLFGSYLAAGTTSPLYASAGVLAFVLGMRHAFDADHLAAIDDCTRLTVGSGRSSVAIGLYFAIGHSLVVLVLFTVVITLLNRSAASADSLFGGVGGVVATAAASLFLLFVGVMNLRVLRSVWLTRKKIANEIDDPDAGALPLGGVLTSLLGRRVMGRLTRGWQMILVGFIFGLGLETATEVGLLALSASTAADAGLTFWAMLALPLLFTAGMTLFDSLDSFMMTRLYTSQHSTQHMRLTYNMVMTAFTAAIALTVGSIYLAKLLAYEFSAVKLLPIADISDHFEILGFIIVIVYTVLWLTMAFIDSRNRPRQSDATASASRSPTMTP